MHNIFIHCKETVEITGKKVKGLLKEDSLPEHRLSWMGGMSCWEELSCLFLFLKLIFRVVKKKVKRWNKTVYGYKI